MNSNDLTIGGVIVPLVTPVNENGSIDFDGLAKLVKWLIVKGVNGLFVAGTTGRFSCFTPEQNAEICRVVSDVAGKSATIYGGCCDSGLHRMLANADLMKKSGADAAVITAPYYLSYSIEEIEEDLGKIADRSPLPVVFYNIPEFVGCSLRPEWLEIMADHPNVVGYKDSSNDIAHHLEVLKRTEGKKFNVLIGKELLLYTAFKAGAVGLVLSFANAFPETFVDLVKYVKEGNWAAVEECQARSRNIVEDFEIRRTSTVFSSLMNYLEEELNARGIGIKLNENWGAKFEQQAKSEYPRAKAKTKIALLEGRRDEVV